MTRCASARISSHDHHAFLQPTWRGSGKNKPGVRFPFLDPPALAEMKKTNRERDYAVIGELARLMEDAELQLRYSRSARDLLKLAEKSPDLVEKLLVERPILSSISEGRQPLEVALDRERRDSIRSHEVRLSSYAAAAARWHELWPSVAAEIAGLSLTKAHAVIVERASTVLPTSVEIPKRSLSVNEIRDEFLSEEDLALEDLTDEQLVAYWNLWLLQAQADQRLGREDLLTRRIRPRDRADLAELLDRGFGTTSHGTGSIRRSIASPHRK